MTTSEDGGWCPASWPDVRELKALVDRAIVFAQGPELTTDDFPLESVAIAISHTSDVQPRDKCDTSPLLPLAQIERERVLQACDGNIAEAARTLQMNRATLYRRIAEYNGA